MRPLMTVMILLLLLAPIAAFADSGPDVEVTLQRTEPFPAEPGTYTDVYLLVNNNIGVAKDLQIEFKPDYPFTLAPGESQTKFIGNLGALQDNYAVVQYRVDVAPDARNKDYNLTVYSSSKESQARIKWEFPLTVKGTDAQITLDSYAFEPETIRPGEKANLTLTLHNTGRSDVKDIDVSLDFSDSRITTIGSGTTKRVTRLDHGENADVTFSVILDGSMDVGVIDVPVKLDFRDRLNTQYQKSTSVGMIVQAEPELTLRLDDTTLTEPGTVGDVSVQVVNRGIVDLRYVSVKLEPSPDYESLSYSDEVYIGNLESDDFEIADLKIKPLSPEPVLRFTTTFRDPYNKEYKQMHQLPLRIISQEDLGQSSSNTGMIVAILAVLVVGGGLYYRRRKNHRKMSRHAEEQKRTQKRRK